MECCVGGDAESGIASAAAFNGDIGKWNTARVAHTMWSRGHTESGTSFVPVALHEEFESHAGLRCAARTLREKDGVANLHRDAQT